MKINWFKINSIEVYQVLDWIIDTFDYEPEIVSSFIRYLKIGHTCEDCEKFYNYCLCADYCCEKCYQLECICNMNILKWSERNLNKKTYEKVKKNFI